MATRLRLPWLEQKKKRVHVLAGYRQTVALTPEQEACLAEIRERIESGRRLPAYCYRVNRDSSGDALLVREGIMHLHLSRKDRNAILFLVQYEDHVVFLDVTDHAPFRDDPPGSYLAELHANALGRLEAALDAEEHDTKATAVAKVREGLKPRGKPGGTPS
jgi:hypothetical protein